METAFIVVRIGATTNVTKIHPTMESAKAEAERLCRKERAEFAIFRAIAYVKPSDIPVKWEEISDPFDRREIG